MNKQLHNTIVDLVSDFLYYDRKEDEDLPRGEIETMIAEGRTSADAIVKTFATELEKGLQP